MLTMVMKSTKRTSDLCGSSSKENVYIWFDSRGEESNQIHLALLGPKYGQGHGKYEAYTILSSLENGVVRPTVIDDRYLLLHNLLFYTLTFYFPGTS
jgi:hypothetical protein